MAASAQVGGKAAGKVTGFALRTAAKVATLGQMGKKKEEGAGQTKAEKRQRAVRHRRGELGEQACYESRVWQGLCPEAHARRA